jgi:hypothetical protein
MWFKDAKKIPLRLNPVNKTKYSLDLSTNVSHPFCLKSNIGLLAR